MAEKAPIPKRGAAADQDTHPGLSEGANTDGDTDAIGAEKGSDKAAKPEPTAEERAEFKAAQEKEAARLAEVNAKLEAATHDPQNTAQANRDKAAETGVPALTDAQRVQLDQAYSQGPEFIRSGRMSMDQAVRDIAGNFRLPQEEVRAKLEAGVERLNRQAVQVTEEAKDLVLCNVPKAFNLRLAATIVVPIKQGPQRMPRAHAEHWYSKANGVTIVE